MLTSFVNRGTAEPQSITGWLAHSLALQAGLTSTQLDVDGSHTPGLQLRLLDRGDELTLWLGYAGYRREYAEGLLDALLGLLRTGLDDPDTALAATLAAPTREP